MKTLYVVALIIACGISLAAQERVITEAEYTEIAAQAEKSLYGGSHGPVRLLLETEVVTPGAPDYMLKSVTLIAKGQGTHTVEDRSYGGKPTKTESITVDDRTFIRNGDGSWNLTERTAKPTEESAKKPGTGAQALENDVICKYAGIEKIGDRTVHVYTKSERKKSVNAQTGATTESEKNGKLWISTDGTFFKNEIYTKSSFSGRPGHTKIVVEVQADPTIKIVAPDVT